MTFNLSDNDPDHLPDDAILADAYLEEAECRARRFQGAWTGTTGTLAADVIRLLRELRLRRPKAPPITTAPMPRLIGLCGLAGCGKDLVASMLQGPGVRRIAFADPLYEGLAAMLGVSVQSLRERWKKEMPICLRTPRQIGKSPRQMLQSLGTEWGRGMVAEHLWVTLAEARWEEAWKSGVRTIVVPDVRFDNEVDAIRRHFGQVWLVKRPGVIPVNPHESERAFDPLSVDCVVANDGTVGDLRSAVQAVLDSTAPVSRPAETRPSGGSAQAST